MADDQMRYGAVLPGGTATEQLELALLAEEAGWDGVFVWEAAYGPDAWSMLSAMAVRTERVRLGTHADAAALAAALEGRQPGRDAGPAVRRPRDPRRRRWRDRHRTARYRRGHRPARPGRAARRGHRPDPDALGRRHELPRQALRLPDRPARPRQRGPAGAAADSHLGSRGVAGPEVHAPDAALRRRDPAVRRAWSRAAASRRQRGPGLAQRAWRCGGFDVIADGETPAADPAAAAATAASWAQAGCSWWLETRWEARDQMRERLAAGPPRAPSPAAPL